MNDLVFYFITFKLYKSNNKERNMLYTTQQLAGGPKYSAKTRIGNWKEDIELEEMKYALLVY